MVVYKRKRRALLVKLVLVWIGCGRVATSQAPANVQESEGCAQIGSRCIPIPQQAPDEADAARWEGECERGDPLGCRALGRWYSDPDHRGDSAGFYRRAAELLARRCESGRADDCQQLAHVYQEAPKEVADGNQSVYRALGKAASFHREACARGGVYDCYLLGMMYEDGTGVRKDIHKAVDLLRRACDGGSVEACSHAGHRYYQGHKLPRDHAKAISYLKKACEAGDVSDCFATGEAYRFGDSAVRDPAKAVDWYRRTCEAKEVGGCYRLGVMIALGEGVPQDAIRAQELLQGACDGGVEGPVRGEACRTLTALKEGMKK